ncbi:MAG: hypothetical protein ACYDG2_14865 [Ruminiclostridium sp.]
MQLHNFHAGTKLRKEMRGTSEKITSDNASPIDCFYPIDEDDELPF